MYPVPCGMHNPLTSVLPVCFWPFNTTGGEAVFRIVSDPSPKWRYLLNNERSAGFSEYLGWLRNGLRIKQHSVGQHTGIRSACCALEGMFGCSLPAQCKAAAAAAVSALCLAAFLGYL